MDDKVLKYYISNVDRVLNREIIDDKDINASVNYWNLGEDADYYTTTNVSVYANHDIDASYYIDIYPDRISIENELDRIKWTKIDTTYFTNESDEEFFQAGIVQDLTIFDEKLMRKLIKISLLTRHNKAKESK